MGIRAWGVTSCLLSCVHGTGVAALGRRNFRSCPSIFVGAASAAANVGAGVGAAGAAGAGSAVLLSNQFSHLLV